MYTSPSSPDSARCWVPCIDNIWERCTWEFEFVVPKYLEEQEFDPTSMDFDGDDGSADAGRHPTLVVCSGDLVEQVSIGKLRVRKDFMSYRRLRIPIIQTRLFFSFHKVPSHLCNTSLSPPDLSMYIQFLSILQGIMRNQRVAKHSCMLSAYPVLNRHYLLP